MIKRLALVVSLLLASPAVAQDINNPGPPTPVSTANGGLGANNSSANGIPVFSSGTSTVTATTGTGSPVRATSPTLSGTVIVSALNNTAGISNASGGSGAVQLYNPGGGQFTGPYWIVKIPDVALTAGTVTINLSGASVFNNTSYSCQATYTSTSASTATPLRCQKISASQIVVSNQAGVGTDTVDITLIGN